EAGVGEELGDRHLLGGAEDLEDADAGRVRQALEEVRLDLVERRGGVGEHGSPGLMDFSIHHTREPPTAAVTLGTGPCRREDRPRRRAAVRVARPPAGPPGPTLAA